MVKNGERGYMSSGDLVDAVAAAMARLMSQAMDEQVRPAFSFGSIPHSNYHCGYVNYDPATERTFAIPQCCCGEVAQEVLVDGEVVLYICSICKRQWAPTMPIKRFGYRRVMTYVMPERATKQL